MEYHYSTVKKDEPWNVQVNGEHKKIILREVIWTQKSNATSVLPNSGFSDMSKTTE